MYLLLGDYRDPWCLSVYTMLKARSLEGRIISSPLVYPSRFVWHLNNEQSESQLWDAELPIFDNQITGVFVRSTSWIDSNGWEPADLAYTLAETQAALLGWLWSLPCPVVNRYPAAIWYRPNAPLLSWQPLLRRCSLPASESLITNVEHEARAFEHVSPTEGNSAVYKPLTGNVCYLLTSEEDWTGLAAVQRYTPVCLTHAHGEAQFVCVVGERVVKGSQVSSEITLLEPALRYFAKTIGLDFVELALAFTSKGLGVIAVEPYPCFDHFEESARHEIIEGIFDLFTAEIDYSHKDAVHLLKRSLL